MSNPSYLSTCCCNKSSFVEPCMDLDKSVLQESSVDIACVVSSAISLIGVVYLFLPRPDSDLRNTLSTSQTRILAGNAVRKIIHMIVITDVLAVICIIIRSGVNLSNHRNQEFCLFINILIQFWFICNYFWNLVYGFELLMSLKNVEHNFMKYIIGILPAVLLTTLQVLMLYYSPTKWCLNDDFEKTLVYLSCYIPIALVLIVNPIIFYVILRTVRLMMIRSLGRFGISERQVLEAARFKFTLILIVFVLCWIPNIVFALLQLFEEEDTMHGVFLAVAIIQAITNPLQAMLNCMVYRGWPGAFTSCSRHQIRVASANNNSSSENFEGSIEVRINSLSNKYSRSEREPVLSFRNQNYNRYT